MLLKKLEQYQSILIQCHDNPDADSIASGYGLYCYFAEKNLSVRLIYGGRFLIQKQNIKQMVECLEIPIEHMKRMPRVAPDLLITVDCQYGNGNVTLFPAIHTVSIDHHQISDCRADEMEIRSHYGSCSTLVWELLIEAGFSVNSRQKLATALYYGLYCDTANLSDIIYQIDKEMRDSIFFEPQIIRELRNSNISVEEMKIAARALNECHYIEEYQFAVIHAEACDPNILGIVGDFMLQTDRINISVAYNEASDGYKLSVRSCLHHVSASELALYLTKGLGSGGGHMEKAGGFIQKQLFHSEKNGIEMLTYILQTTEKFMIKAFHNMKKLP